MNEWYFNPVMFQIGPITAHWYGFMYAISFLMGYFYLQYSEPGKKMKLTSSQKDTLVAVIIAGVILGGRIGYILFYNLGYYLTSPLKIFAVWEGGMSFHGGLLGVAVALTWFTRKHKVSYLEIGDVITRFAPVGLFLAKIGNFINAELYGRIATQYCIHFPTDPENCRYPSQLLEAFLEGFVLFFVLFFIGKKTRKTGTVTSAFLIFYGIFRIIAEFFREPDAHIGFLFGIITEGQLLSSLMILAGITVFLMVSRDKKKHK